MQFILFIIFLSATQVFAKTSATDACIEAWGSKSPFKKGTAATKTISTSVKVMGIGKSRNGDFEVTDKPSLILIKPTVNVMGKSTIRLENPNGWYCFSSNVTVMGKISIEADCKAQIASANESGAAVMAADDSDKGVAVMGSLRVTRFNCK